MKIAPALSAAALLLATAPLALSSAPAAAATPAHGGFGSGTVAFVSALDLPATAVARVSLGQSAVGAGVGQALTTRDALGSTVLSQPTSGRSAYGHGAGLGVGLLQDSAAVPQVALSTAEATSPAPRVATPSAVLPVALAPLASAQVLSSTARALSASTTSACPASGDVISEGSGQLAAASLLSLGAGQAVVGVGGTSRSRSALTVDGGALVSRTVQALAPVTLFQGVPGAAVGIDVLRDLELTTRAAGRSGTATVSYGFAGVARDDATTPVLALTVGGQRTALTSQQVLGSGGLRLSLGVADVVIGAPATTSAAADGTTAAGAADLVRVSVPGTLPTGSTTPVGGPLAPLLNPVLTPVVSALSPVLTSLQSALRSAGLGVADVRYGHLEGSVRAPAGGLTCASGTGAGALTETRADVSTQGPAAGTTFDVTIRVPNRGDLPLREVTVVDRYSGGPPGLEVVSTSPRTTSTGDGTLTFGLGTIAPGDYEDVTITFRVPPGADPGTVYRNDVTVTGVYDGGRATEQVSAPPVTVVAPPTVGGCDLSDSVVLASNTRVLSGDELAYLVHATNTGGTRCTGTTVTQQLDDGVTFVSCTDGCTHSGRTVTWELGPLAPGGSQTVSVTVRTTATSGTLPTTVVLDPDAGPSSTESTAGPTVTTVSAARDPLAGGCPATGCAAAGDGAPGDGTGTGGTGGTGSSTGDGTGGSTGAGSDGSTGAGSGGDASGDDDLARTGPTALWSALGVLLLGGAAALHRRERRLG